MELTGKDGIRRLPIKDFYIKAGQVDIRAEEGEIQTAILIPKAELRKLLWLLHQVRHEKRDGHRDARVQRERAPVARQADY